jgi:GT2 family glycosyltransferase
MVSIITVNYNGFRDTCELIGSLKAHEPCPFEVIVVDNASRNEEGRRLKELYEEDGIVTVVCSDVNTGFGGGNKLGYSYAKGEYILYMNNDMYIERPFLQHLINRLDSSDKTGAVSPKILFNEPKGIIQYAGFTAFSPVTLRNHLIGFGKEENECNIAGETFSPHGACMLTSRRIVEKAGMMTDIYFLFYEEFDWSLQLKRAGYGSWYEPASAVFHKESMSVPKGTPLRQYYMTRSRLLFARRNLNGADRFLSCLYQALIVMPRNLLVYALKGKWKMAAASWKGAWEGLTVKKK